MFAYRQLALHNNSMSKSLQRLSSGYRINSAADDAAGLAISERMRAQITALNQAARNTQDAISMVNVAEGAMIEVNSMLNRMVDLATYAANGTVTDEDRLNMQKEVDQLLAEIERIAGSTSFGSKKLLDGSTPEEGVKIQVGADSKAHSSIYVVMPNLGKLVEGLNGLNITTQEAAREAMKSINDAIRNVTGARGNLGAMANRMEYVTRSLDTTIENLTAAESRIRDADMAKEMMNFTKSQMLSQVAMMMMAHANQQPYQILTLLRTM